MQRLAFSRFVFPGIVFASLFLPLASAVSAADDPSLDQRVTALETRLKSVHAQLGKLDFIVEHLQAIREQDLPKLHRDLRQLSETSARSDASPQAPDGTLEGSSAAIDTPDVNGSTSSTEESIEQQLKKLDDIAEMLSELRGEDLPKLVRDLRAMQKDAGRVAHKLPADGADRAPRRGVVVVHNATLGLYRVAINGVVRDVPPGRTEVEVDYGPITTELTGFEAAKTWDTSYWQNVGDRDQIVLNLQ